MPAEEGGVWEVKSRHSGRSFLQSGTCVWPCVPGCVRVNWDLIGRKIKAHVWLNPSQTFFFFPGTARPGGCGLQHPPKILGAASCSVPAPCWAAAVCDGSYLLDLHYQTGFTPFICSLSAALNINYRGTLQLDISSFTLYLKQHAATSKSRRSLWCCREKEPRPSTKNQGNFLELCFIHLLPPKVWSRSLEVQTCCLYFSKATSPIARMILH